MSALLAMGLLTAPIAAAAEEEPQGGLEVMSEFNPADFVAEAAELPLDLVDALAEDVDLTPEEYLAQGAAAVQGVEVVTSLEESGVVVLGSRMEGTELVVNVASEAEAAVVESTGATVEYGEPAPTWDPTGLVASPAADVYSGQGWIWTDANTGDTYQCSVGFTGKLVSSGANQFATAGHCVEGMNAQARAWNQTAPGSAGSPGATLGALVSGTTFQGNNKDVARIASGSNTSKSSALTWGSGGKGAPLSSTAIKLTGDAAPIVGAALCKSGSRTGWACGPIVQVDYVVSVGSSSGSYSVNAVVAAVCVLPGDSGGAAMIGGKAVGITSFTYANPTQTGNSCTDPANQQYGGFFQMISPSGGPSESVAASYGGVWEMTALPSAPVITAATSSGNKDTAINGRVPNPGVNYKVDMYINGSSSIAATANVNPSTGNWSINVGSLPAGIHKFTAVARYGTWSTSSPTTGFINRANVDRISGSDRFATSAAVASEFAGSPDRVYIASGLNYPDALSAAPVAAINGAPLLLTAPDSLPTAIRTALTSINPSEVVLLGGTPSVSANVRNQIAALLPGVSISRIAGSDRFETSRLVSQSGFPSGATSSYVATGLNFPDALSAGAAAASVPAPVVLVNGAASSLDTATRNLLVSLDINNAFITGSTPSVSAGIQSGIDAISGVSVQRLSGPDRYLTSVAINDFAFSSATEAYLAVGTGFADALSGAALAGATGAPLFVVPGNCVPTATISAMYDMGITAVHLLGSAASLDGSVAALRSC